MSHFRSRTSAAAAAMLLLCSFASAAGWHQFGVGPLGFVFDVPAEFALERQSDNGDGATFAGPDGASLAVWGMWLDREAFRGEIAARLRQDEADGWDITYRRVTGSWASYSGTRGDTIRYVRAISVCGDRAAMFLMDYPRSDKRAYDETVTHMVRSLKAEGC